MVKRFKLARRKSARGDKEELALAAGYTADREGWVYKDGERTPLYFSDAGYCVFRIWDRTIYVHRFVWRFFNGPIPKDKVIDHINRIKSDSALSNLRCVTPGQNNKNRGFTMRADHG